MDKDNQRGEPCCRDLLGAVYLYDSEDLPPVLQTSKSCGFWSYIHFTHATEQMIKFGSSGLHSLQISQSSALCNAAALKTKHNLAQPSIFATSEGSIALRARADHPYGQ